MEGNGKKIHVSLSSLGRYLEPSQQQVDNAVAAARRAMSA
jgi:hypothetical protein